MLFNSFNFDKKWNQETLTFVWLVLAEFSALHMVNFYLISTGSSCVYQRSLEFLRCLIALLKLWIFWEFLAWLVSDWSTFFDFLFFSVLVPETHRHLKKFMQQFLKSNFAKSKSIQYYLLKRCFVFEFLLQVLAQSWSCFGKNKIIYSNNNNNTNNTGIYPSTCNAVINVCPD